MVSYRLPFPAPYEVLLVVIELAWSRLALVPRQPLTAQVAPYRVARDPQHPCDLRMLFPCRLKTRISTASSATNMRPSAAEYPTPGWVSFQSATRISFASATTLWCHRGIRAFSNDDPGGLTLCVYRQVVYKSNDPSSLFLTIVRNPHQAQASPSQFMLSSYCFRHTTKIIEYTSIESKSALVEVC